MLTISATDQRRFILAQQGLYPGRRWRGKSGVLTALHEGAAVQIDPLNVVARSHHITLHSRVIDYQPAHLDDLMYKDRLAFDWGGTVLIYPMRELPYWRVIMERKGKQKRADEFFAAYPTVTADVLAAIRDRGALSSRSLEHAKEKIHTTGYRSANVTSRALYYLWLSGELMSHSRSGNERVYDLRERIAPAEYSHAVSPDEADNYFARRLFDNLGIVTARSFRNFLYGTIVRPVTPAEAADRLAALLAAGEIVEIRLAGDTKTPRYIAANYLHHLGMLHAGSIPDDWQPLDSTTSEEVTILAPLEIVSARGRAKPLFEFEYLWEVYKPAAKRRWGYYTLPILYGDRLVARFDSKLDRASKTLNVLGFWLEDWFTPDTQFKSALRVGMEQFARFLDARTVANTVAGL
ncbi:MAG: YcaQ family DNA glycosylase [Anaerolineae bacterium]|nr:YcaQ family DNA glycosylase [Anaerolineae bacterium]